MTYDKVADKVEQWVSNLIGTGDAADQMVASVILGAIIIGSSAVTFGWTLALLPVALAFFAVGLIRLVPVVDNNYPL